MLRHLMHSWWQRVGSTKVAGITKLMVSEGTQFPELTAFYRSEVIEPGHALLRRLIQRGIDRGEFKPVDVELAIYTLVAPMVFLMLSRHASSVCYDSRMSLDAEGYISIQAETILGGLCKPA
jgi:hypothetical protein